MKVQEIARSFEVREVARMGYRVYGIGYRVSGIGYRVQSLGYIVQT